MQRQSGQWDQSAPQQKKQRRLSLSGQWGQLDQQLLRLLPWPLLAL
jgi:hypothetical protein